MINTITPLAITMGDPAGIGPEIIAKVIAERDASSVPYLVIGDICVLKKAAESIGLTLAIHELSPSLSSFQTAWERGDVSVLQAGEPVTEDLVIGKIDPRAGAASYRWVNRAIDLAITGKIAGIVTAPINKAAMRAAGITYPGHTEILADRCGINNFAMMLANDELRVILVSIHLSLREAIDAVTVMNELRTIRLAHEACQAFGISHPRVAVAGLNPHAGENGLFGREDAAIIAPAIEAAKSEGIDASGPWPGDTVFMRARRGDFDIVVAQYHDQGLIPVKYMGIDQGVNVTVGLPFVRTSVDHGTAFDIAGSGKADHSSLLYALKQASAIVAASASHPLVKPEGKVPDFIFMLTRNDRTIADAQQCVQEVLAAGVSHIGFKDTGLPFETLKQLTQTIRAGGGTVYLEVVSLDEASEVRSAQAARELGVDVLMGGTRPGSVLPVINGSGIRYYPFPGRIVNHPSVLEGSIDEIVASAKAIAALDGVHGLDLLAYRFAGDVPELIKRVCAAVTKPVVIAGSIDRYQRIASVVDGNAAGFTIGTAALDGVFPASKPGLAGQLEQIHILLYRAVSPSPTSDKP